MPIQILMPALSPTMTEGAIVSWLKAEGDQIKSGDLLAEIETDKATMELEAVDEGVLGKILYKEGSEGVAVNEPIALLLEEGEEPSTIEDVNMGAEQVSASEGNSLNEVDLEVPGEAQSEVNVPSVEDTTEQSNKSMELATDPEKNKSSVAHKKTANGLSSEITVREALGNAIAEEMRRDPEIFMMGEEIGEYQGAYKVSQGLLEEFGDKRIIDTPITEHGMTGLGVGAAFGGLKPIVEFMTFNFAMQAMDQIVNSAAKTRYMSGGQMSLPIVFRGPNGAAAGVAAQHSQCFASWFSHIPGLKVVSPWSGADAKGLLKSAIRDPNPVIFLEHELLYGEKFTVPDNQEYTIPLGSANVEKIGGDVTVISYSRMVQVALEAADILAGDGIEVEVINLRTLRPLDVDTIISSLKKTNRIVSLEEGWPVAGLGAEISAIVMEKGFDYLDAPVVRVCGADVPMPYAQNLEAEYLPDVKQLVNAINSVCYR